MTERQTRTLLAADLELRSDGRTVVGLAVPFDTPTFIPSLRAEEAFDRGAFTRTISERGDRIKLLAQHDTRSLPLGRLTSLREDTAGLFVEGRISETQAGDEAIALVRDGALDSFSIGFSPVRDEMRGASCTAPKSGCTTSSSQRSRRTRQPVWPPSATRLTRTLIQNSSPPVWASTSNTEPPKEQP